MYYFLIRFPVFLDFCATPLVLEGTSNLKHAEMSTARRMLAMKYVSYPAQMSRSNPFVYHLPTELMPFLCCQGTPQSGAHVQAGNTPHYVALARAQQATAAPPAAMAQVSDYCRLQNEWLFKAGLIGEAYARFAATT